MKRKNLLWASGLFVILAMVLGSNLAMGQDGGVPGAAVVTAPAEGDVAQPGAQPAATDAPKPDAAAEAPKEEGTTTLPDGTVTPSGPGDSDELDMDNLLKLTGKVWSDWRTYGWMAGVIALLNLLIFVLRIKPLNAWLEKKGLKKYKPYVAMALGAGLMALASIKTGVPIAQAIIAGLMFGWTSSGLHQSIFPTKKVDG